MPEIIPLTADVHFKCAFDISSDTVPKIMTHARQKIRAWCINKVGVNDQTLHRAWFYIGNNPKIEPAQYTINDYQVRTVSAPSADPEEPTCWAFEMVHPDSDERSRRWSVEITLRKSDDGSVRFTTIVKNWMFANYIGEYPPSPNASAPFYVRSLLDDAQLACKKGDAALHSKPVIVTNKSCQGVYDALASDQRHVPFVFIADSPGDGGPLVIPARVAAALIGNANVFVLSCASVVDEMNYYLGEVLRCEYGSVRVYLPSLDKSNPANARLHRYLSASYIAQHGEDSILRFLTNGLSRNGSTFRLSDLTSFSDIYTERRKFAIKKLAIENQAKSIEASLALEDNERLAKDAANLTSAYQGKSEESSLLWEENDRLSKDAAHWESTAIQYDTENAEIKKEVAGLRARIEEADRVRHRIADLESQVMGVEQLSSMPTNLCDVLKTICRLFPNRIEVTEDALATAEEYAEEHDGYWEKAEQLDIAWQLVFGVATKLYSLVFEEDSKRLEDAFGESFSLFELAMNEGRQTKKDARLMGLRTVLYQGREIDITPHIKYGNRKPKLLRLYFAICRDEKKFVLGHFGDHLENYSSRKQ